MTVGQMRLHMREGDRVERQRRAAFVADVFAAAAGVMGDGKSTQDAIDKLLGG